MDDYPGVDYRAMQDFAAIAILLREISFGILIAGLFYTFGMFAIGRLFSAIADHETDHDIEKDIDHDVEKDFDHDVDHDLDHDVDHDIDHDIEHDIEHDIDHDVDHEVDHDLDYDVDHDIDHDVVHGILAPFENSLHIRYIHVVVRHHFRNFRHKPLAVRPATGDHKRFCLHGVERRSLPGKIFDLHMQTRRGEGFVEV